jgi:ABC-type nitrate/sulfonate/bicarbonate transport system permease component
MPRENRHMLRWRWLRPLSTVCLILVLWAIVTVTGMVNPIFLPRLDAFGAAILKSLSTDTTYTAALLTTFRAFVGLVLSIFVAVPLGLFFGRYPRFYEFVELPTDFFRSIPSSALFFLFILIFGIGDISKIAVVFYGCSLIMLVNTVYGARPTREKRDRINMLRSFGASPLQIFTQAVFRDALPSICAGIRVCISLSLVLVIVTEMFLGATAGLGRLIYDHYLTYRVPEMYAVVTILGVIGFAANKGFQLIEHRICFWLPKEEEIL